MSPPHPFHLHTIKITPIYVKYFSCPLGFLSLQITFIITNVENDIVNCRVQ